jgi:hypothetical protein
LGLGFPAGNRFHPYPHATGGDDLVHDDMDENDSLQKLPKVFCSIRILALSVPLAPEGY